jgi:arylsulfatase A-like enzyme
VVTDVLPPSATTLAEALRDAGYRTFGFSTNPFLIPSFGFAQGFDEFRFFAGGDFARADQVVGDAIDALRASDRRRPAFVWVHLMEPHSPYVPPPWTAGVFRPSGAPEPIGRDVAIPDWLIPGTPRDRRVYVAAYDNEVAAADVAVDTLIREFAAVRPLRPSVIVVTSDHGEQFLDHDGWEHSSNLFDELIRVPLVIKAPDAPPGVVRSQVQLVDIYPTLLEYAGADTPPLAGRSLIGLLQRKEDSEPAVSEIAGSLYALREDGWKLIMSAAGGVQLFDLEADPGERHDVAGAQPDRVHRMRAALQHELARAVERGRDIRSETAPVDPAVAERLRSLGYIQQ